MGMNAASKALQRRHQAVIRWVKVSTSYYHRRAATPLSIISRLTCRTRPHVCLSSATSIDDYSKTTNAVAATDDSRINLPSLPIEFDIAAKIEGEESHVATIQLNPGETLRAESGAMLYMTDGVESMLSRSVASLKNLAYRISLFRPSGDKNGRNGICF